MRTDLTPTDKIKFLILQNLGVNITGTMDDYADITADSIYALFDSVGHTHGDWMQDATQEVRNSGQETGLPAQTSRHYECKAVAAQLPDETWVGWNYWFGGGKHGEPEAIEWMEGAYNVIAVPTHMIVNVFQRAVDFESQAARTVAEIVDTATFDIPPAEGKTIESRRRELEAMEKGGELRPTDDADAAGYLIAIREIEAETVALKSHWQMQSYRDATQAHMPLVYIILRAPF